MIAFLLALACSHQAPPPTAVAEAPSTTAASNEATTLSFDPDAPLPFDPRVTTGQLDNGLRYFIEHSSRPKGRVELRLVVRVGSVLEDDDQLGLAHFVEHMAFNGTEHFPGTSLVDALQSFGMGFGAHLNASTTYTRTMYQLTVPTDAPEVLDTAMLVLEDWAGAVAFDEDEIEAERGVVIEEWRRSRGVMQRWRDAYYDLLLEGSRYAERDPIGTELSLNSFAPDAAARFYADWYRPELMSLVVVGDIDPQQIEAEVRERFSDLAIPADPRPWSLPELPEHGEARYMVQIDPELSSATFAITAVEDREEPDSWAEYRSMVVENMAATILNQRIDSRTRKPDSPLLGAGYGVQAMFPGSVNHTLSGQAKLESVEEGIELALVEVERAKRHGATPAELDRARRQVARSYEDYLAQSDKESAAEAAAELVRHITTGEAVPGTEAESRFVDMMLPTVTLDEINQAMTAFLPDKNRIVGVAMPEDRKVKPPSEAALSAIIEGVPSQDIAPPDASVTTAPLVTAHPAPGAILGERSIESVGVTEWTLDNGATVLLKPTDFETDTVLYRSYSWGGDSLYDGEDEVPARTATAIAARSGLGDHDLDALVDIMAGKRVSLMPQIGSHSEGFMGQASTEDIEMLFQLVWLRSQQPRLDGDTLERTRAAMAEQLRNRYAHPHAKFEREWSRVLWQDHPRMAKWELDRLDQMDLERSRTIYMERLGNAGDAVHVLVGNFDIEAIRPAVETWLGSIPAAPDDESWRDLDVRPVTGRHEVTVRAGTDPKAMVQIRFGGQFDSSPDTRHELRSLAEVLQLSLSDALREDRGGTYSVSVRPHTEEVPEHAYSLTISFQCDPNRVDELIEVTDETIAAFTRGPVPPAAVQAVAEQQRRQWEVNQERNTWWMSAIAGNRKRGEDPAEILRYNELWRNLSAKSVRKAAEKYINPEDRMIGMLLPEDPAPSE